MRIAVRYDSRRTCPLPRLRRGASQDTIDPAVLNVSRVTPAFEEFSLMELVQDVIPEFDLEWGTPGSNSTCTASGNL